MSAAGQGCRRSKAGLAIRFLLLLVGLAAVEVCRGDGEGLPMLGALPPGDSITLAGTRWTVSWDQRATWELLFRADHVLVASWLSRKRVRRDDNFSEYTYKVESMEMGEWRVAEGRVRFRFVDPAAKTYDRQSKTWAPTVYDCAASLSDSVMSGEYSEGSKAPVAWKAVQFRTASAVDHPKPLPYLTVRPGRPLGVAADIQIEAMVAPDGLVTATRVVKSSNRRLNRYFQKAVENWRFLPATAGGQAIEAKTILSFVYTVDEKTR